MANLRLFSLALLLLTSCGLTTRVATLPDNKHQLNVVPAVNGKFLSIDGPEMDLNPPSTTSQVLMFVSETCSVCRKETKNLVSDRQLRGAAKNVVFISVIVGSELQDAKDWRADLGVDWHVGIDPGDNLFRKYCPEGQTPCIFLTNSNLGATIKITGEHSLKEWEQITGPWVF
jgi:thioredoxin-related protein